MPSPRITGQGAVEQNEIGRNLADSVTLGVERALGRGQEQAKDQGGQRPDDPKASFMTSLESALR